MQFAEQRDKLISPFKKTKPNITLQGKNKN